MNITSLGLFLNIFGYVVCIGCFLSRFFTHLKFHVRIQVVLRKLILPVQKVSLVLPVSWS